MLNVIQHFAYRHIILSIGLKELENNANPLHSKNYYKQSSILQSTLQIENDMNKTKQVY